MPPGKPISKNRNHVMGNNGTLHTFKTKNEISPETSQFQKHKVPGTGFIQSDVDAEDQPFACDKALRWLEELDKPGGG